MSTGSITTVSLNGHPDAAVPGSGGRTRFHVCLMGAALDCLNMGVAALSASFTGLVLSLRATAEVGLFIGHRSSDRQSLFGKRGKVDVEIINFRISPKSKPSEHLFFLLLLAGISRIIPIQSLRRALIASNARLQALSVADLVGDIRGGDSFSDIYGLRNFLMGSVPSVIALLLGKKLVLLPQTYGPYKSPVAKKVARWIIKGSAMVLSRDRQGIEFLQELLGKEDYKQLDVRFCPDLAFTLESILPGKIQVRPPLAVPEGEVLIGINVSGLLYNAKKADGNRFNMKLDYPAFVVETALRLLEEPRTRVLLVPHTFGLPGTLESDPDACIDVMTRLTERFPGRVHLLEGVYDQFRIKGIIGQCDFFIGARMHACIAALSQEIPAIGVAYSKKFIGVFDSVGAGEMVINGREAGQAEAVQFVMERYRARQDYQARMQSGVREAKALIVQIFGELVAEKEIQFQPKTSVACANRLS